MAEVPKPSPAIVALGADLFFLSRIEGMARRLGLPFASARTPDELDARLGLVGPGLVLVDLSTPGLEVAEAVAIARAHGATVVAFGPHRDVAARARALAAGCDEWLPNSKLMAELPELLRRHGGLSSC